MRYLVTTITYDPDLEGIGVYSTDFVKYLLEEGHQVDVVTRFSYYPAWTKKPEDRRRLFGKEASGNLPVWRGYLFVPKPVTSIKRMIHELSFSLFALINLLRQSRMP